MKVIKILCVFVLPGTTWFSLNLEINIYNFLGDPLLKAAM